MSRNAPRLVSALFALLLLAVLFLFWPAAEPPQRTEAPEVAPVTHQQVARVRVAVAPPSPEPEAVEAAPTGKMRCPVTLDEPVEGEVGFTIDMPSSVPGTTTHILGKAELGPDFVEFGDHPDSLGTGQLTVPGYLKADVTWSEDGCPEITLRRAAVVVGTVVTHGLGDRVYVRGCGGFATVAEDDGFYLEAAAGEPCRLHAERRDGWYGVKSEAVTITPTHERETEVTLHMPAKLQGGLGARLEEHPRGMMVAQLRRGSAGHTAGLLPGDLVVAIDGQFTAPMDAYQFAEISVGPVGDRYTLGVERGDEVLTMEVERSFLESSSELVQVGSGYTSQERPDAWVD